MNKRNTLLIGAGLVCGSVLGLALATPIVNLASPFLSIGVAEDAISTHGVAETSDGHFFNARLTTDGPSNISIQEAAYAAGGKNGWHSHPGLVMVTVLQGSLEWFDDACHSHIYNVGDSWTEGSARHAFRNVGPGTLTVSAVFVTAKGVPYRTDKSAPACAAELGL